MENKVVRSGIKNIVYVLVAQVVSLFLGFGTSFILPAFLGVTQFGHWQVYLFYSGYVVLFCLGFNDGLYLRYGKYDYKDLPFSILRTSLKIFISLLVIFTSITLLLILFGTNSEKKFAFILIAINILIIGLNGTLTMVYQFTNRIKLYSISTILTKILFICLIAALLFLDKSDYKNVILADTFSKIIILLFNLYFCKELLFGKSVSFKIGLIETIDNMKIGINLMIANLMGMLILGSGRFIIERFLSIEEFGLYSFAITTTNLTLLFISSISLALYPMLKRLPESVIPQYYKKINTLLCLIIFGMLVLYFPVCWVIETLMPPYLPILKYLFILFPIVVAQGKLQLLVNTYYKTLREEREMLKANISSVILFFVTAVPSFYIFKSVFPIAVCTLLTMLWRCYSSEIYLKKKMNLGEFSNIYEELLIIFLFIIFAIIENRLIGLVCYLVTLVTYLFRHKNDIRNYIKIIISIIFHKKKYDY